jgi:DNA-binding MarR family transcriptional regulator
MTKARRADPLKLSWDEIGFLCEGMALAARSMGIATRSITEEFSLGPRGAWITVLITTGQVYPLDLTKVFQVGRSLITAELTRLTEAGLITYGKSASDGRRVQLKLTPLGDTVQRRVKGELSNLVKQCLSSFKREEILLCARMLGEFGLPSQETMEPGRPKRRRPAKRAPVAVPGRRSR